MMTAYSYVRFSSGTQAKGHSLERQTQKAREVCNQKGWHLETELLKPDLAVSGYKAGKSNIHSGNLKAFLGLARQGRLAAQPLLLVENLDRISRQDVRIILPVFIDLLNDGVDVYTLSDGYHYRHDNEDGFADIQFALIGFWRANQESKRKAELLSARWEKRRTQIQSGIAAQNRLPFWLQREDGKVSLVPESAETVKQIFEWAFNGYGIRAIVELLNKGEKLPRKSKWVQSSVTNVLHNPLAYGAFQSFQRVEGRKIPKGKNVEGLVEPVVSKGMFFAVQHKITQRKTLTGQTGRKKGDMVLNNLFRGIPVCKHCGARMVYSMKGGRGYLVCNNWHINRKCLRALFNYRAFERSFLWFMDWDNSQLYQGAAQIEVNAKVSERDKLRQKILTLKDELRKAAKSPQAVIDLIAEFEEEEKALDGEIGTLRAQQASADYIPAKLAAASKAVKSINPDRREDRFAIREGIRAVVRNIVIDAPALSYVVEYASGKRVEARVGRVSRGPQKAKWRYTLTPESTWVWGERGREFLFVEETAGSAWVSWKRPQGGKQ